MPLLEALRDALYEEGIPTGLGNRETLEARFREALRRDAIRELIEWSAPPITECAGALDSPIEGAVRVLRMDRYEGVPNLKKPVVAGLLLREVLRNRLPRKSVRCLADSGNMNTGFALRYYCEKAEMSGLYVMSRHFPPDMVEMLSSSSFRIVVAPARPNTGMEREFYAHLFDIMRMSDYRDSTHCLWHAKHGGAVIYPLGLEVAAKLPSAPDCLVVSIGSGTTLEMLGGIQDALQAQGLKRPRMVVVEHELSPIYARGHAAKPPEVTPDWLMEDASAESFDRGRFRSPPPGPIRHSVIGSHYDEANPLLEKHTVVRIDYVQQYTDEQWMRMSHYLESRSMPVGNSSAANLFVSYALASQGLNVLTVVVEPMRCYYKARQ